jgi:hypothetical protein
MIRMYSKRLLSPFVGLVQVADIGRARALSLDGRNWAIQYSMIDDARSRNRRPVADPNLSYSLVATIEHGRLKTHAVHPFLEPEDVRWAINRLAEAVTAARLPFAAADRYEYWLLDCNDETPLALLHSCIEEQDMGLAPPRPVWIAMSAAQLDVQPPEASQDCYVPPVNYRLQKLVAERAGARPRAAWFERPAPATVGFPPCLIREDWENEERQQLCDLYIQRLAPRLLMMQDLSRSERHRLERAARDHVFEVERFHLLYPEVVDTSLLTAARVEARLRHAAEA